MLLSHINKSKGLIHQSMKRCELSQISQYRHFSSPKFEFDLTGMSDESEGIPNLDNLFEIPTSKPVVDDFGRVYATGKRKTSVARVWIKEGCGEFIINDKELIDYCQSLQRQNLLKAFLKSKTAGLYDVWCTVKGGGISGQAEAIRHGIARALDKANPSLRKLMRPHGLLTRDTRIVERKKAGRKKARKQFQWVKR